MLHYLGFKDTYFRGMIGCFIKYPNSNCNWLVIYPNLFSSKVTATSISAFDTLTTFTKEGVLKELFKSAFTSYGVKGFPIEINILHVKISHDRKITIFYDLVGKYPIIKSFTLTFPQLKSLLTTGSVIFQYKKLFRFRDEATRKITVEFSIKQ